MKRKKTPSSSSSKPGHSTTQGRPRVILGGGEHLVIASDTLFDDDLYGDEVDPEAGVIKIIDDVTLRSIW